jgi:uncharacterized cupredoxin-like copper-binding protein
MIPRSRVSLSGRTDQMKFGIMLAAISLALVGAELPVVASAASTTVSVKATEFKYSLSKSKLSRGTVTFKIKNAGHLKHDFKINGKKSKMLNPGASTTLKVSFGKAGKYTYLCTVPGHAQAGMKGKLTVK